jgi:integrase/recombinase XerD
MKITLSQAIEGYQLAARARRLSAQTLADYGNTLTKFQCFLQDDYPIGEISVDQIREFLAAQDSVAAKTLLNYHTGLSALWQWASKEGLVSSNIVREVDPPRPERKAIEPYSQHDVKAMLHALGHSHAYKRKRDRSKMTHSLSTDVVVRNRAILLLLLDTGLRASELCRLRVGDVNLRNRKLKVMGKGAKERILPFSANTGTALWRYLASQGKDRKSPGRPLFTTAHGQPLTRVNLYHIVQRIGSRAGVGDATVHRFRHTYAIQYLRNKGNPYALQMSLGHSTMEMTRRYLAIAEADLDADHQVASPVANWDLR